MAKFFSCFEGATEAERRQTFLDILGFWICGLMNNFVYVVFLSAAADILEGSGVPKAVVLLADCLPSLLIKIVAPYFMHRIPYMWRIVFCSLLSVLALQLNGWFEDIYVQLIGVTLASLSCGFGEINFLALCTYYPKNVVAGWSSGTGGAGLFGSLLYLALTTWFRLSYFVTMMIMSPLPLLMLVAYFFLMSKPHLVTEVLRSIAKPSSITPDRARLLSDSEEEHDSDDGEVASIKYINRDFEDEGSGYRPSIRSSRSRTEKMAPANLSFLERLVILRGLVLPYILPLFVVYWAEYTINQGISPTLLFDYNEGTTPFKELRDHYVYYQFLYQAGVFVSRSSVVLFRIKWTWIPAILQIITLIFLLMESLYSFIPTVFVVFLFIFWEGLLGGSAYANTYYNINVDTKQEHREFSMSACGLADGLGILLAGVTSLFLEPALCDYQVAHGNNLCELVH